MGSFKLEFQAVGGHGCQREAKEGERFVGCGRMGCPDCECKRVVEDLRKRFSNVEKATLTHWPGNTDAVVDDLSEPGAMVKRTSPALTAKRPPGPARGSRTRGPRSTT